MLTIGDHRRDFLGLRYVYPVVSRRAGGVSVGINLNPNNACNWACVYCQVPNLVRGSAPPIDESLLEVELSGFLDALIHGDFMATQVPEGGRHLVDLAFSGNGEPTSAKNFPEIVHRVKSVMDRFSLLGKVPLRLITNGSLLHRASVRQGIAGLAADGEVWFKLDRATTAEMSFVNGVNGRISGVRERLRCCAELAPTWVQTCWFASDGVLPGESSVLAYCDLLRPLAGLLRGIHLYGLARPSCQPGAERIAAASEEQMHVFARRVEKETGVTVRVSL